VVLDSRAGLSSESKLVTTARDVPVLVAAGSEATEADRRRLAEAGCEVIVCEGDDHAARLDALLVELGRRRLTNVLVEGGGRLLGSLFDAGQVDEVHAFIAPKLVGGAEAPTAIAGVGLAEMTQAVMLDEPVISQVGSDVYVSGRVHRNG
jgi:diaminohydroxyphosphoribosylaminopyrimidine deaminase/5-amino-6-(5-phosphoribosylamino)uracil reductase